jgi:signal transduction histidine kinase
MTDLRQRRSFQLLASHLLAACLGAVSWHLKSRWGLPGFFGGAAVVVIAAVFFTRTHLAALAGQLLRLAHHVAGVSPKNLGAGLKPLTDDPALIRLVDELNAMAIRLADGYKGMNEYAARVAHELRSPLHTLRTRLEANYEKLDPALAETIHDEMARLGYVIDQTLLLAKAEHSKLSLHIEQFELGSELELLFGDFELIFGDRNRAFIWRIEPGLRINADRRQVRQIVHNLLSNALNHGGGDVVARVRRDPSGTVRVSLANRVGAGAKSTRALNLGYGLRVVDSLTRAQPGGRLRRHAGARWYCVRIDFPEALKGKPTPHELQNAGRERPEPARPAVPAGAG